MPTYDVHLASHEDFAELSALFERDFSRSTFNDDSLDHVLFKLPVARGLLVGPYSAALSASAAAPVSNCSRASRA